jgi:SAM-dependent methyltransferase
LTADRWVTEARPPRPNLADGTSAHYRDAEYYDRAYRTLREDVELYLLTALEHGGPILELGCGTGRVTLPLARAGFSVTGIDISQEMLERARGKLRAEASPVRRRVDLRLADMRTLRLRRRYRLVISPFNVVQHLYTRRDFELACATVRHHLEPRTGRFVFDVLLPDVASLNRNPTRRYHLGQVVHPAGGKRYDYRESFDYDPMAQVQLVTMRFEDPDDPAGTFETPLAHRQFFPLELEALVHYNGLEVVERYGGFDRSDLTEDSSSQIYVCRRS